MDDSQNTANESQASAASQDTGLTAPQQAETTEQYAGWSVSGEATDVGFVLGYN